MRSFAPETATELAEWLQARVSEEGGSGPLVISGSDRRALPEGLEPGPQSLVSLSRMADVEDFRPSDLTVTVGAGMRIDFLQRLVREEGLWLAASESGTGQSVGGWVAAAPVQQLGNSVGPVRRQVLACTIVLHDGRVTKWGRAVMKNVAGYDIPRLVCGSRGRLGIMTSLTLRLWPAPRIVRHLRLTGKDASVVSDALAAAPDAGGWVWRERPGDGRFSIDCVLRGGETAVAIRGKEIEEWARAAGLRLQDAALADDPGVGADRQGQTRPATGAIYRMSFGRRYLPAGLAQIRRRLAELGGSNILVAYPGPGVVRIEAEGLLSANRRAAPVWLTALVGSGSAGRIRPERIESGPVLRVERGGPEEHSAVRHLRSAAVRTIESRILDAFGGREAPWQAEYI